jgi:regulatory protein
MEHGEVTAITSCRGSKRRAVHVGGEQRAIMPAAIVKALGLQVGDTVALDELYARRLELEPQYARERAFRLLAYRERSTNEMADRLTDEGYLQSIVADTVSWLTETALLDDERFAEQMARSMVILRGFGRQRALRELRRFGIADDCATRALDPVAPAEGETERAHDMARRLSRPSDTVDRLAARLVRRGFSTSDSLTAARSCVSPPEGADPDDAC